MPLELLDFMLRNKLVILFYSALALFVYRNRGRFQFHMKLIALYKAKWGIGLMDKLASSMRGVVKSFGYLSIFVGFAGMLAVVLGLFYFVYVLFTTPNAPAAIAPVIPGVQIPGVPFRIPLVEGVIAIFIVAVIHEFCHGVVARAHNVKVKNTGVGILGPILFAFVEPDEADLKQRSAAVNFSIFAAGPVSNLVVFLLLMLALSFAVPPVVDSVYPPQGIVFTSVDEGSPAEAAGLQTGAVYNRVNGQTVSTVLDFIRHFEGVKPGDEVRIGNDGGSIAVQTVPHADDASKPWLGVQIQEVRQNSDSASFAAVSWLINLLALVSFLSLGIGLGNLIPVGPIDGGRMLQKLLHKFRGEASGNKDLVRISMLFLFIILLLLTPIFRETLKALFGFITGVFGF